MNEYPSKLLEQAIQELSRLPGIGERTAMRLALHLLRKDPSEALALGQAVIKMREEIKFCSQCGNVSDTEICSICSDPKRDTQRLCIVESIRDVLAIEKTRQYRGRYHVLGGVINPMEGVSADSLNFSPLAKRIELEDIHELIMALPATIEGDTTIYYIHRNFSNNKLEISVLARGVAIGDELEFADEVTLGRSIINRTPYLIEDE